MAVYLVDVYPCDVYPESTYQEAVYGDRCGGGGDENIISIEDMGEGLFAVLSTVVHNLTESDQVIITGTPDGMHDGVFDVATIVDPTIFTINSSGATTLGGHWEVI